MSGNTSTKRVLALDLGQARIGVALSDVLGWTAQPVGTIQARSSEQAIGHIRRMVREHEVGTIVLGMPYNMDGSEGPQAAWVRQFGERLAAAVPEITVVYWDERLSTVASESFLIETGMTGRKRRQHRDKIAAALILQSYLEHQRSRPARQTDGDLPSSGSEVSDEDQSS